MDGGAGEWIEQKGISYSVNNLWTECVHVKGREVYIRSMVVVAIAVVVIVWRWRSRWLPDCGTVIMYYYLYAWQRMAF